MSKNLLATDKLAGKPVKAVSEILKTHLNPKSIEIAERYKFYLRGQLEGESLKQYIAELQKLADHCNFNSFFEEALRDGYVCGLHDGALRQRLLIAKAVALIHYNSADVWNAESKSLSSAKRDRKLKLF